MVASARPALLACVDESISAFDWELEDDGRPSMDGRDATEGILSDGCWLAFTPPERLRRSGQRRNVKLEPGDFVPPFEPPRDPDDKHREYTGITYGGHSAHSVDFNRGSSETDRDDPVYAAARGTVAKVVANDGEVHIRHDNGTFTIYAHMSSMEIRQGEDVGVNKRIGRIGSKCFKPGVSISPRLHHQHRQGPTTLIVMKFAGMSMAT